MDVKLRQKTMTGYWRIFKTFRAIMLPLAMAAMASSCGPSLAYVDRSMNNAILWPGKPEKPRIAYLWSLRRVTGAKEPGWVGTVFSGAIGTGYIKPRDAEILMNPHGLFVSEDEKLYVADPGASRVNVIDLKTGESFYFYNTIDGDFLYPLGIAVNPEGMIYVTDPDMKKVFMFDQSGKNIKVFDMEFLRPTGIAIDRSRQIVYVTDTWAHKIDKFTYEGEYIGSIGERGNGEGRLNYPTHIAVGPEGRLYVADTGNFKVQVFSADGEYISEFGYAGDSFDAFDKVKGISVDREGHIYVVDSGQDMVKIFDLKGRLLLFFGKRGSFYGDFSLPTGIYIDGHDRIYVSDSYNMRIQAFQFLGGS